MINKLKLSILVIGFGFCSLFAADSRAFVVPLPTIPWMPTFDASNNVLHTLQNTGAMGVVKNLTDLKRTMGSLNDIKGLGDVYKKGICFVNCDAAKSGNKKAVKAGKDIQESEMFDVTDPVAVKMAYYNNFLVIPSAGISDRKCYTDLSKKFYKDSVIELYSSSLQLEKDIVDLEKRLAELEVALEEGGTNEEAQVDGVDNTNTALENAYLANEIHDKILRVAQELKAMDVAYEAAVSNIGKVSPVEKRESDNLKINADDKSNSGKVSFIFNEGKKFAASSYLGFAQKSATSNEDFSYLMRKVPAPKADSLSTPFEGQEKNLASLQEINIVGEDIYAASDIHNLISELPSYKEIFKSYEQFVAMHNHALNLLKVSEQCTITYLGNYYTNPEQVWSGGNLGTAVNQYDKRKGISRWVIDTFDVAKAKMVSPVSEEDLAVGMLDSSSDNKKITNINTLKSQNQVSTFARNPVKELESTKIGRENFQLPWNIGAEAARDLGKDQQSGSKWGSLKRAFPMWKDQKNYYNQYVDGKYGNIVKYLERVDLRPSEIEISREYNKQNKDKIVGAFENSAKRNACAWSPGPECNWAVNLKNSQDVISLDAIVASLLPESQWVAPVKQKLEAMPSNHIKLDEREKALNKRKKYLLKRKAWLLAISYSVDEEIAEIDAELKKLNTELKDLAENRKWLQDFAHDLTGVVKVEGWTIATNVELISAQAKEQEVVDGLENEFRGALSSYNEVIGKILQEKKSEMDGYNARLETISTQIGKSESKVKLYAQTVNRAEEDTIAYKEEFTSSDKSAVNKNALKSKVETENAKIGTLAKEADTIIQKIDERNKYYDGRLANAERELSVKTVKLLERGPSYDDMAPLSYLYSNKVAKAVSGADSAYTGALTGYLKSAFAIAEEFRPYTVDMAEKTQSDILALGDSLYEVRSIEPVNQRHKELLNELKGISFDNLIAYSKVLKNTYNSPVVMMEFVKDLYNKYMIEVICPSDACYASDDEYFIGLFAKGKDFQSLKEPIGEYMPPLREVLFFDETDFSNLYSKNNRIKIVDSAGTTIGGITIGHSYHYVYYVSKTGILNYGGRVPEVWKYALSGNAFVEKDIDLEKFLGADDDYIASTNFYRGGRYPCNLNGRIIDIDRNANFIMASGSTKGMQLCQDIEFKNSGLYSTVVSKGTDETAHIGVGESMSRDYNSELGQLFLSKEGYIVYRETTENVFSRLNEIMKYQEEQKTYNSSIKDDVYSNASLKANQFGDFLNYVETERAYRNAKEKIKVNIDDAKETLFQQLRRIGYEPKEDLNMANEDDYNTVKKALKSKKTRLMSDITPKVRVIKENQTQLVKDRFENFENVFKAMELDSEELLSVATSNVNLSEFSESIKTEKVNLKAREEYSKEAEEGFAKELKKLSAPYCASY